MGLPWKNVYNIAITYLAIYVWYSVSHCNILLFIYLMQTILRWQISMEQTSVELLCCMAFYGSYDRYEYIETVFIYGITFFLNT